MLLAVPFDDDLEVGELRAFGAHDLRALHLGFDRVFHGILDFSGGPSSSMTSPRSLSVTDDFAPFTR